MVRVLSYLCFGALMGAALAGIKVENDEEAQKLENSLPVCPGISDNERTTLMMEHIKDQDIHDRLVGDFVEVYGPKQFFSKDADYRICVTKHVTKIDDNTLHQELTFFNAKNGEMKVLYSNLIKKKNGIYVVQKTDGTVISNLYYVYAGTDVIAHFVCSIESMNSILQVLGKFLSVFKFLHVFVDNKGERLPRISNVSVRKSAIEDGGLVKLDVQPALLEARNKILGNTKLYGGLVYNRPCATTRGSFAARLEGGGTTALPELDKSGEHLGDNDDAYADEVVDKIQEGELVHEGEEQEEEEEEKDDHKKGVTKKTLEEEEKVTDKEKTEEKKEEKDDHKDGVTTKAVEKEAKATDNEKTEDKKEEKEEKKEKVEEKKEEKEEVKKEEKEEVKKEEKEEVKKEEKEEVKKEEKEEVKKEEGGKKEHKKKEDGEEEEEEEE